MDEEQVNWFFDEINKLLQRVAVYDWPTAHYWLNKWFAA